MTTILPLEEKLKIATQLESQNVLFRAFWDYGTFNFSTERPTAWVEFDQEGGFFNFSFNPEFYQTLDLYTVAFICAHEMLHIIFEHGSRTQGVNEDNDDLRYCLNQALDTVVNHYLVKHFNFEREKITNQENYCWVDTIFPNNQDAKGQIVQDDQDWEYYFTRILELRKLTEQSKEPSLEQPGQQSSQQPRQQSQPGQPDIHTFLDHPGLFEEEIREAVNKAVGECQFSKEELEEIFPEDSEAAKNVQAGAGTGFFHNVTVRKVKTKRKWESVIKHWEKATKKTFEKDYARWDRKDRRLHHILQGQDIFLPADMTLEETTFKKNRITVTFFLDVSGSCYHLKDRLFHAARTLSPKVFDVKLYSFDTGIRQLDIKVPKVYGGGGTCFRVIQKEVERLQKEQKKHPTVWIITDGHGTSISPTHPEKWYWFLTPGGSRHYIPQQSKVFSLSDFE